MRKLAIGLLGVLAAVVALGVFGRSVTAQVRGTILYVKAAATSCQPTNANRSAVRSGDSLRVLLNGDTYRCAIDTGPALVPIEEVDHVLVWVVDDDPDPGDDIRARVCMRQLGEATVTCGEWVSTQGASNAQQTLTAHAPALTTNAITTIEWLDVSLPYQGTPPPGHTFSELRGYAVRGL